MKYTLYISISKFDYDNNIVNETFHLKFDQQPKNHIF